MKTILLYGDSNTWGANPNPADSYGERFDHHTRWGGVLRDTLGEGYWVVEEGLSGRTTVWDDPYEPYRNGAAVLPAILLSHRPLDLVVILLGTNDLKRRFNLSPYDIAAGAFRLAEIVGEIAPAPVLLICPPPAVSLAPTRFTDMFAGAEEKSRQLWPHYTAQAAAFAEKYPGVALHLLNAGNHITSNAHDGIHWHADQHRKLGEAVAGQIRAIFEGQNPVQSVIE